MENMDKGVTVPKLVLIVGPNMLQIAQNLYSQFVCSIPKVLDFNEKGFILGVRSPWFVTYIQSLNSTLYSYIALQLTMYVLCLF
jgi:hypothetical protein